MTTRYDIEIVTHCYAAVLPFYRAQLQYQVASLFYDCPPDLRVCLSVCTTQHDRETVDFLNLAKVRLPDWITIKPVVLQPGWLYRRAVGRNLRALVGEASIYWFTDVDYFFGPQCLTALASQMNEASGLSYPKHVRINPKHAIGDAMTKDLTPSAKLFPVANFDQFEVIEQKRCIGGVHIIGRDRLLQTNPDTGKLYGYINGHRKCQPVDPSEGFRQCRCDLPFKNLHAPAKHIDLPNVFRIRHTTAGRAYDQSGNRLYEMKGDHD